MVPLEVSEQSIHLAMADPNDLDIIKELVFSLGRYIRPIAAPRIQIRTVVRCIKEKGGKFDQPLRETRCTGTPCLEFPPSQ